MVLVLEADHQAVVVQVGAVVEVVVDQEVVLGRVRLVPGWP